MRATSVMSGLRAHQRVALRRLQSLDAQDLARIEVERFAFGLGVRADDRVKHWLPLTVLRVQERGRLAPSAVRERPEPALETLLERLRQRVVGRVHAGEQGVAAPARNGQRVE